MTCAPSRYHPQHCTGACHDVLALLSRGLVCSYPIVNGVYMDDQLCGTLVQNNTFIDCQQAVLVGGGRDTAVVGNNFVRCTTGIQGRGAVRSCPCGASVVVRGHHRYA